MNYHHQREPLATPPEDPMGINPNMKHPNGYYYQHQGVVKQSPNMVGNHHVAMVNNQIDPYNLMMPNDCHGNQVQGMM